MLEVMEPLKFDMTSEIAEEFKWSPQPVYEVSNELADDGVIRKTKLEVRRVV